MVPLAGRIASFVDDTRLTYNMTPALDHKLDVDMVDFKTLGRKKLTSDLTELQRCDNHL